MTLKVFIFILEVGVLYYKNFVTLAEYRVVIIPAQTTAQERFSNPYTYFHSSHTSLCCPLKYSVFDILTNGLLALQENMLHDHCIVFMFAFLAEADQQLVGA